MRLLVLSALGLALVLGAPTAQSQQTPRVTKPAAPPKAKAKTKKPATAATKPAAEAQPVISFGRTPCFGRCPHFTAHIFPDGRVEYEGFEHAPVQGKRTLKMAPASMQRILQEANRIGFRQLQDKYSSGATDLPSTTLAIRYPNGARKAVMAEDNVPPALQQLFTLVNAEVEKALGVVNDR